MTRITSRAITFLAVVVGWVFFRATNLASAMEILKSMAGFRGLGLATGPFPNDIANWDTASIWITILLVIVWWAPNSQQLTIRYRPVLEMHLLSQRPAAPRWMLWRPSLIWGGAMVVLGFFALGISLFRAESEFLYFQF